MRQAKTYNVEDRRFLEESLYCNYCGNSNAFQIDLRLKHLLTSESGSVTVELLKSYTNRVMNVVQKNVEKLLEKGWEGKPLFRCANCHAEETLDTMGRSYDYCSWNGCPGCFTCGCWIDKEELVELCSECITESKGTVTEEDCIYNCPNCDAGFTEVMDHYNITLRDLKEKLGYKS